jgi:hypothetical protein
MDTHPPDGVPCLGAGMPEPLSLQLHPDSVILSSSSEKYA